MPDHQAAVSEQKQPGWLRDVWHLPARAADATNVGVTSPGSPAAGRPTPGAFRACPTAAFRWPAGSASLRLWLADAAGVTVTRPGCPVTGGSRAGEESED